MQVVRKNNRISSRLLTFCGVWLIGLGIYFIFFRPPLLPEDASFIGTSLSQIQATLPGIEKWLNMVFIVMGGFMSGAGVLIIFLATMIMPLRLKSTGWVIALSGGCTVILMSGTNFALNSDFKMLLLVPALIWLTSLGLYLSK